jgi:uncharacterized membrane-anchored protein
MRHSGIAKLDTRTKDLTKRLEREDIAIIDHLDIDRVSADALLATGIDCVVNASLSISGTYPNLGPLLLARGGVHILDGVGPEIFERIKEGQSIDIVGQDVLLGDVVVARGTWLTVESIEESMEAARAGIGEQLDRFARNTLEYLDREKALLTDHVGIPDTRVSFAERQALVVVRGHDYREDLNALRPYIREMRPVLIGVDGGADAILEAGFTPDIIVGDMDSVTDEALRCGAQIIVHAYADGRAPGMERIDSLGLSATTWPLSATSEDLALLLAFESGADLIVAVGTHANLFEYLDKGRKGMASTFLVRLKVGPRLVDAKGVNKLYRSTVGTSHLLVLTAAGLAVITVILTISPQVREMLALILLRIRAWFGI